MKIDTKNDEFEQKRCKICKKYEKIDSINDDFDEILQNFLDLKRCKGMQIL